MASLAGREHAPSVVARSGIQAATGIVTLARAEGSVVCERCVVAHRTLPRMKGLLGKRELPAGEGMLIRPAPSIQTFFMRFPIDVVFLARDGEVLKVADNVKPWRARACRGAHAVLELAAGEAKRRRIAAGNRIHVRAPESA